MNELVSFVLARVAEDEAACRALPDPATRAQRLAECQAVRRIIAGCVTVGSSGRDVVGELLRALALPYEAHPGYRSQWRPDRGSDPASAPVGDVAAASGASVADFPHVDAGSRQVFAGRVFG